MNPENFFNPEAPVAEAISPEPVTQLLKEAQAGDRAALDALLPLVYGELRRLAAAHLSRERVGHTLQPTALVHEAYLRLVDQHSADWRNRAHFFGLAAEMMRRILVNHAVSRNAAKRGSGETHIALDEALSFSKARDVNLVRLDEALKRLADLDGEQAKIVELRFFAGLSVEEVADVMDISDTTVKRKWRAARAWLFAQIS